MTFFLRGIYRHQKGFSTVVPDVLETNETWFRKLEELGVAHSISGIRFRHSKQRIKFRTTTINTGRSVNNKGNLICIIMYQLSA